MPERITLETERLFGPRGQALKLNSESLLRLSCSLLCLVTGGGEPTETSSLQRNPLIPPRERDSQ